MQNSLQQRFVRWFVIAVACGSLLYLGGSVWAGFDKIKDELPQFQWIYFAAAIGLTLLTPG